MIEEIIERKKHCKELFLADYYAVIDEMLKNGITKDVQKFFISLNSFGMTKKEVLNLTLALRDSGRVLKYNQTILEKHSTGGVADSTSMVLIPLLASMGYKIIKTTAKSFKFTNGGADRFGAIPGFSCKLSDEEIQKVLEKTNACVLSHDGDMCPADKTLFKIREDLNLEGDINLLAASIASKKLASGAKVVLVDIKYGYSSIVKEYSDALKLANILKYVFGKNDVKSVIVITNTLQTIGEAVGNAVEVVDALDVLKGKKCVLRDISIVYATEMILKANPRMSRTALEEMIESVLDNGTAYARFLEIVKAQNGSVEAVEKQEFFKPYNSVNFVSDRDGYVGRISSITLGELIRRLCKESHDNNIGAILRVKIGDYVKKGDSIITFYYKDKADFEKYRSAIAGCIRTTEKYIKPLPIIRKVIR